MSKQQFEDLTMSFNPEMVEVKSGSYAYYTGDHTEESVAGNNRGRVLNEEIFWEEARLSNIAKRESAFLAIERTMPKMAEALANNVCTLFIDGEVILLTSGTNNGLSFEITKNEASELQEEANKIKSQAQEIGFF